MAETIIDHLELIDVEEQHTDHATVAARIGDRLPQTVVHQVAVGQFRQFVVIGTVLELLRMAFVLRDVVDDADEMRHGA